MTSGSTPPRRTLCNSRYDDCAVSTSASSWRGGSTIDPPARGLEEAIDADAVERLRVGPLSVGALQLLLKRRLDRTFPRGVMLRLIETSGGNPFYALELARGLAAEGAIDPTEPFPVPESLDRLVTAHVEQLDRATREALLVVAAHGRPTTALLRASGIAPELLDAAVATGSVENLEGRRSFQPPAARVGALPERVARATARCPRAACRARRRPGRSRTPPGARGRRAG